MVTLPPSQLLNGVTLAGLSPEGTGLQPFEGADTEAIREQLQVEGPFEVLEVRARAPNFAVGSSKLLSFAKKAAPAPAVAQSSATKAVWSLDDDMDDMEVDLVDDDDLLDEEDKVKPDEASLRGEEGKKWTKLYFCRNRVLKGG